MELRPDMDNKQRIVVKIGSALLTDGGRLIDSAAISQWVAQIAELIHAGKEVILVSSGAVAAGMSQLGWGERPTRINELQAAAAVGQMGLVRIYQDLFSEFELTTAQILLDHDDLSSRQRYINARSALTTLLDFNVVPVVNENDTVATDEIRFGDNDSLAAMVANLVDADLLVILTDQDGMYTADPRSNPDAELLSEVSAADPRLDAMASGGGTLGRGGMVTKVKAARLAARSGTDTIVVGGRLPSVITRISAGEPLGTWLKADQQPQQARKQWLAGLMQVRGQLVLDTGAVTVLKTRGRSLLAVGVLASIGSYQRGDLVECVSEQGVVIARGLCNYSGREVEQISGQPTEQIASILGYKDEDELIHRDNMIVL